MHRQQDSNMFIPNQAVRCCLHKNYTCNENLNKSDENMKGNKQEINTSSNTTTSQVEAGTDRIYSVLTGLPKCFIMIDLQYCVKLSD